MRVLITGATGTIGLALADALRARGDQVVALSRDPERGPRVLGDGAEVHAWPEPTQAPPPAEALAGADAIVHLLGEPVAQRWTPEARERIRDSRVLGTRMLVEGLRAVAEDQRPKVLVSQSATGYYGPRGDAPLDEHAAAGQRFPGRGHRGLGAGGARRAVPDAAWSTRGPASCSRPAAARWPRCSPSSSSGSAVRSPAVTSTSPGSTSMTWSAR